MKRETVLGIDRGSKYIGLAYYQKGQIVIFPIGYILNDKMTYFSIADIIERYSVKTIVLGWPTQQKDIQEKIQKFIASLGFIIEGNKIEIKLVDENYTSVQSGEIVSDFKQRSSQDTISAMLILERYQKEGALDI